MIPLPAIIGDYVPNGGGYVYALEIEPFAIDAWTAKRYSTAAVTIDGDGYADAIAQSISRIVQQARIVQQGGAGTFPDLTVRLINRDRLHEDFISDNIVNRKATLRMTAVSGNRCLNSSFEAGTPGAAPDKWTCHTAAGGGNVAVSVAEQYDGNQSLLISSTDVANGSWAECDTIARGMRRGERLWVSTYARQYTAAAEIGMALKIEINGAWGYVNTTTHAITPGRVINWLGNTDATWRRFSMDYDWSAFYTANPAVACEHFNVVVELWTRPDEGFYADAAQIEAWPNAAPTAYRHNRHELTGDDCLTVFTGIVKRPKWKHDTIEFQLEAWSANTHRMIPVTMIDEVAATNSWVVPKESSGKPFPITYGSFYNANLLWIQGNFRSPARGILVNTDHTLADGVEVYFDRPGMSLLTVAPTPARHLCCFDESSGYYHSQSNYTRAAYSYDAKEMSEDLAANARYKQSANPLWILQQRFPLQVHLPGRIVIASSLVTNPGNVVNDDHSTTYGHSTAVNANVYVEVGVQSFTYSNADIMLDSGIWYDHRCIFLTGGGEYVDLGGAAGNVRVDAIWPRKGYTTYVNIVLGGPGSSWSAFPIGTNTAYPIGTLFESSFPTDSLVRLRIDTSALSNHEIRIYSVGILIYCLSQLDKTQFAGRLFGRTFQDTWGGRRTATDMVQSPGDVIESILRLELGAVAADIDVTKFNAVATARSYINHWTAAGQLHERKRSQEVIDTICSNFGLVYHINEVGQHTLRALDYKAIPDATLTMQDFIDPLKNLQISQTPREAAVNNVRVLYDKDQYTDDFRLVAYCNKDGRSGSIAAAYQTKCDDSYDELGEREQAIEIECEWCNLTASAENIVKWIIDWNRSQRLIVEGPLKMKYAGLELGDTVALDIALLLPSIKTSASRFIVTQKSVEREKGIVNVQLLEVLEP